MPTHLIWGDDRGSIDHAINHLIEKIIDPNWISLNLSRLNGQDLAQVNQALEEVQTPPFGTGGRIVVLIKSPFCNGCTPELVEKFEKGLKQIPNNTHLVLVNSNKPDQRLKITKLLQNLKKSKEVFEQKFILPPIWDELGQKKLIQDIAQKLNLEIEEEAISAIIDAIGNDSVRIMSELQKISLLEKTKYIQKKNNTIIINKEIVNNLVFGHTTNSLEISNYLIDGKIGEAILKIDYLLDQGEPALKIIATLTSQIRGLLWVALLDKDHKNDINFIAKKAGISNPKRIYFMRKQIKGKSTNFLINLLGKVLEIEAMLKRGESAKNSFRDGLLINV